MNRFRMTTATLGLLTASLVPSMRAGETDKETRMTINGPLQVQDTLLAPGQYVFRLTEPDIDHSVVSIYNADDTRHCHGLVDLPRRRWRQKDVHDFSTPRGPTSQTANLVLPWRQFRTRVLSKEPC